MLAQLLPLLLGATVAYAQGDGHNTTCKVADSKTFYDFSVGNLDGTNSSLSKYNGKVVMVVNTAAF